MTLLAPVTVPLPGGRTNVVWREGETVWKRYLPANATPLFPNDPDAEWCALNALDGQDIAPRPLAREDRPDGPHLAYAHLGGATHATDPADLARLLGRLHAIAPPPGLPLVPIGSEVIAQGRAMCSDRTILARAPKAPDAPQRVFCHRDPVPGNVVQTGQGPRLIDWQCPGAGDPVEDIAHALSPAMHVLYGSKDPGPEGRAAFLAAYPDPAVAARYRAQGVAFHWRMACYCQWQVARGTSAYAPALAAELELLNG